MTTPQQRSAGAFLDDEHRVASDALDDRLAAAFRRYDEAFHTRRRGPEQRLISARMDLSLLLWEDDEVPEQVQAQLALDGATLLRDTPPL